MSTRGVGRREIFSDGLTLGGVLEAGVDPGHHGSFGRCSLAAYCSQEEPFSFTADDVKVSRQDFILEKWCRAGLKKINK